MLDASRSGEQASSSFVSCENSDQKRQTRQSTTVASVAPDVGTKKRSSQSRPSAGRVTATWLASGTALS
jgi:hypothetical protein